MLNNLLDDLTDLETSNQSLLTYSQKQPELYQVYNQHLDLQTRSETLYMDLGALMEVQPEEAVNWSEVQTLTNKWPDLEAELKQAFQYVKALD